MRRLSDDANFIFYVSFLSVVCDCSLCTFTKGRGLTLAFARVLVQAPTDGPGLQPTDTVDLSKCAVRALVPTVAV